MDLIFFDLDGTLLNNASEISTFTKDTLGLLSEKDIAYTVATGRTMLAAKHLIEDHAFTLPHIYNNGVTIWDPEHESLTLENLLDNAEISTVLSIATSHNITPFVNTLENHHHNIYFPDPQTEVEKELVNKHFSRSDATLLPLAAMPSNAQVTNISMIGDSSAITDIWKTLNSYSNLIAYSGPAIQGQNCRWLDVHHCMASKGGAVENLKNRLGASNVICFGDSDNDLSMFALANESYAPENASDEVKHAANAVIGHHHKDGIAHFLRERFSL
ncbi:HAD family hydrolase [Glaciecola sp. 2405UD65-10]|uniref:HAD family hydrolase n=1 Tax=Glaciecola sp. 2405UD65-10 TaxID=3397244 RepID=UPI003B596035